MSARELAITIVVESPDAVEALKQVDLLLDGQPKRVNVEYSEFMRWRLDRERRKNGEIG